MGGLHTKFTIPCSKIFLEIEKYNPYFKNISCKKRLQKKRGELVQNNSPFLIPKYCQRQKSTIPNCISQKTYCKKNRGDFIKNSRFLHRKIHYVVQKYFLQKMLDKNKGGGRCRTENISRDKKVQFLFLFSTKHVAKRGISYRIHHSYIGKYNFSYKNISHKKCWKK